MKVTHRIPTTQYGYVEVTTDAFAEPELIRAVHDQLLAAFQEKPESTLPEKDFSALIYTTLHNTRDMDVEVWEKCNPAQKNFLKLLTNAMNRKKPVKNSDTMTNAEAEDLLGH